MTETELLAKMKSLGILLKALKTEEAEFEKKTAELRNHVEDLKAELRAELVERKESIQTDYLIAQYRKGAVRWDTATLNVYVKSHPEMAVFQKIDKPTVAFSLPKEMPS